MKDKDRERVGNTKLHVQTVDSDLVTNLFLF